MATVALDDRAMAGHEASTASGEILVMDPDAAERAAISGFLSQHGFRVQTAADPVEAEARLNWGPVDIAILGAPRPDAEGLALCRRIAAAGQARVILVSGAASEIDRILGLEFGADDFLAKPFSPRELLARVRAIRRRQGRGAEALVAPVYILEDLAFDAARRELRLAPGGGALVLQAGVVQLLQVFVDHPKQILSREDLVARAGLDPQMDARAVDMRVSRVRQTLRTLGGREMIRTVRGAGYVLDAEVAVRRGPPARFGG